MFASVKRWYIKLKIRKVEAKQVRPLREILLAVSVGQEIPDTAKQKLMELDGIILQLREQGRLSSK